jgi:hypothetical protein
MELTKCAYETCKSKPKEMIGGYCKKHQRFRIYKEGLALGKHFCRNFFRGCDTEVKAGVKTCESCLAKNKLGIVLCSHEGCRFQVNDDKYCGKHSRDKYYDEEKEKGIRYCDIARGCFAHCEKDMASCKSCLESSRVEEKARYDERVFTTEVLRNTLKLNVRVCIMCGNEFDCFMTKHKRESVKCRHCQEMMHRQDEKREGRERVFKKEMLLYPSTYYKHYKSGALKRELPFELTLEHFKILISKPCFYCNHHVSEEANGIDRVDNTKGYIIDNCISCCEMCNRLKHILEIDFFLERSKQIATNTCPTIDFIQMWRHHYPLKAASYNKYKYDSERRGVPLNLTEAQYNEITHKPCYLCGYSNPDGIGIDRMDNTVREYTYENCRPCCKPCNMMKASFSHAEFLDKCKAIAKHNFSLDKSNILFSNEPSGDTLVA